MTVTLTFLKFTGYINNKDKYSRIYRNIWNGGENMEPELIIDPGHGGKDPGGGTNNFWVEKDQVLQISLYQYKRFQELGVPVAITRTKDVYLSPEERTRIVRESGAKYCISNHINAGGGDGVETIHSIYTDGALAKKLANSVAAKGQNIRRVFTRTLPGNSSSDYYYMHRETGSVITVIVEYGFADSKQDDVEQILLYWKEYAEAVVKGYCEYKGHPYSPPKNERSESELYSPSSQSILNSTIEVLQELEKKENGLDPMWRKKLEKNELTNSDAIGLLYVAIQRGIIKI